MSDYSLDIKTEETSWSRRIQDTIFRKVVVEKMMNGFGLISALFVAVCIALTGAFGGLGPLLLLLSVLLGVPLLAAIIFNLKFGVAVLFFSMFTILGLGRLIPDVPFGISFDVFTAALVFGLIVRQAVEKDWSFLRNPISFVVLVWILYNFSLAFNPDAVSRMAWLYTIRGMAALFVLYYVLLYVLDSISYLYVLLFIWLGIAFIGALYGIFQDTIGFRQFEWAWLERDIERYFRYYQFGSLRVWSFFSGPMVFGMLMAYSAVACFFLTGLTRSWVMRFLLVLASIIMLYAMLLSGTRAAYIVPVAALVVYLIMRGGWRMMMAFAGGAVVFIMFLNFPTGNLRLQQFQSAFNPADDASFEVRVQNQEFIQPFVRSHPFGGGLGSTGVWGQRFAPESALAQFPPDSGFVRVAVESGWVGLLLYSLLMLVILHVGIRNYFRIKNRKISLLHLLFFTTIICLILTNYPQETIHSPPLNGLFFLSVVAVTRLVDFDDPKEKPLPDNETAN